MVTKNKLCAIEIESIQKYVNHKIHFEAFYLSICLSFDPSLLDKYFTKCDYFYFLKCFDIHRK